MTAQLVAAQQRVAELTPLVEEADGLWSRVAKARWDTDEAEKVFEALNHATGALRDVVVPSRWVLFGPAFCPYLPLYTFCVLTIVFLQSLIARSRGKSRVHRQ